MHKREKNVELHDAQSRTYGLKVQVGVIGGVLPITPTWAFKPYL